MKSPVRKTHPLLIELPRAVRFPTFSTTCQSVRRAGHEMVNLMIGTTLDTGAALPL